jgi:hypothetical protein
MKLHEEFKLYENMWVQDDLYEGRIKGLPKKSERLLPEEVFNQITASVEAAVDFIKDDWAPLVATRGKYDLSSTYAQALAKNSSGFPDAITRDTNINYKAFLDIVYQKYGLNVKHMLKTGNFVLPAATNFPFGTDDFNDSQDSQYYKLFFNDDRTKAAIYVGSKADCDEFALKILDSEYAKEHLGVSGVALTSSEYKKYRITEAISSQQDTSDMYIIAANGEAGGSLYYIGRDFKAAKKEFRSIARDWRRFGLGGGDTPVCLYKYTGPVDIFDNICTRYEAGENFDYSINIEELGFDLNYCEVLAEEWGEI